MMRLDSLRASASWRWYSSRIPWASPLTRSASSRLVRIRSVRAAMAFWRGGRANFHSSTTSRPNEMIDQTISFVSGRIGFCGLVSSSLTVLGVVLPPPSWPTRWTWPAAFTTASICIGARFLRELQENEDHEPDEGQGLGESDTEEHRGAHHAGGLGLAGHGLDGLADQVPDADARADGGETVGEARRDGLAEADLIGAADLVGRLGDNVHCHWLLSLLVLGVHGTADVHGGEDREDVGLQEGDQDLEAGQPDEHGEGQGGDGLEEPGAFDEGGRQHREGHQQDVAGEHVGEEPDCQREGPHEEGRDELD